MRHQVMRKRNGRKARSDPRRLFAQPFFPDRCVLVVRGDNIEVPAFFKSWIYEESEESINPETRGKRHLNVVSNEGMIEALRG